DVLACFGPAAPIDRRVHDRVIDVVRLLLGFAVPIASVLLVAAVELGVRAEGAQETSLVVRGAAHPAPGDALPFGDRIPGTHLLLDGVRRAIEGVSETAPFRRRGEYVLARRVMQG